MRKLIIALLALMVVGGGVYGAAASLGGIRGTDIGASDHDAISCDADGVRVDLYPWGSSLGAPYGSPPRLRVSFLDVYEIDDDCLGKTATTFITDENGALLGQWSQVVTAGAGPDDNKAFASAALPAPAPLEDVENVHVVIK